MPSSINRRVTLGDPTIHIGWSFRPPINIAEPGPRPLPTPTHPTLPPKPASRAGNPGMPVPCSTQKHRRRELSSCSARSPLIHLVVWRALPPPHVLLAIWLPHNALVAGAARRQAGQRLGMPVGHTGRQSAVRASKTSTGAEEGRTGRRAWGTTSGLCGTSPIPPACVPSWRLSRWPVRRQPRYASWARTAAPAGRREGQEVVHWYIGPGTATWPSLTRGRLAHPAAARTSMLVFAPAGCAPVHTARLCLPYLLTFS